MELVVNGTVAASPVNDELLEQSILSLTGEGDSFVILSRNDMTYMQTSGDPKNGFILEYQEESVDQHYSCTDGDLSASQVVQAFQWYLSGDGRWKTDLKWENELDSLPTGSRIQTIVAIMGIAIAGFVLWRLVSGT